MPITLHLCIFLLIPSRPSSSPVSSTRVPGMFPLWRPNRFIIRHTRAQSTFRVQFLFMASLIPPPPKKRKDWKEIKVFSSTRPVRISEFHTLKPQSFYLLRCLFPTLRKKQSWGVEKQTCDHNCHIFSHYNIDALLGRISFLLFCYHFHSANIAW